MRLRRRWFICMLTLTFIHFCFAEQMNEAEPWLQSSHPRVATLHRRVVVAGRTRSALHIAMTNEALWKLSYEKTAACKLELNISDRPAFSWYANSNVFTLPAVNDFGGNEVWSNSKKRNYCRQIIVAPHTHTLPKEITRVLIIIVLHLT